MYIHIHTPCIIRGLKWHHFFCEVREEVGAGRGARCCLGLGISCKANHDRPDWTKQRRVWLEESAHLLGMACRHTACLCLRRNAMQQAQSMHCRSVLAADITDSKHYSWVQKAASVAAFFLVVDKLLYKNTFKTKRAKRGAKVSSLIIHSGLILNNQNQQLCFN